MPAGGYHKFLPSNVSSWIAEALKPNELRAKMAETAVEMSAIYARELNQG